MKIFKIDRDKKNILVEIPLTKHPGKIRIKERKSYTDSGAPVATRKKTFNENMYIKWQIGYNVEIKKNVNLSTFEGKAEFIFKSSNKKEKSLYELSEYLYYFCEMGVISKKSLIDMKNYIESIPDNCLLENIYRIYKANPVEKEINGIKFLESMIKYPHLIHDFNNGIMGGITIREKQKAIGIQPMLHICFPVSYLKDLENNNLIGRFACPNEIAIFEPNQISLMGGI